MLSIPAIVSVVACCLLGQWFMSIGCNELSQIKKKFLPFFSIWSYSILYTTFFFQILKLKQTNLYSTKLFIFTRFNKGNRCRCTFKVLLFLMFLMHFQLQQQYIFYWEWWLGGCGGQCHSNKRISVQRSRDLKVCCCSSV